MLSAAAARKLEGILDSDERLHVQDPYPIEDHFIANTLSVSARWLLSHPVQCMCACKLHELVKVRRLVNRCVFALHVHDSLALTYLAKSVFGGKAGNRTTPLL